MNRRLLFILTILCILIIIVNVIISYRFTLNFFDNLNNRKKELFDLYLYEGYLSYIKDAETGQRGYIITGDESYLDSYYSALNYLNSKDAKDFLANSLKDSNSLISNKLKKVKQLQVEKIDELNETIILRKEGGFEPAQKALVSKKGKKIMDEIRILMNDIIVLQQKELYGIDLKIQKTMRNTLRILILSNSIAMLMFFLGLYLIYRGLVKTEEKEKELAEALKKLNEALATTEAILNSAQYAIISVNKQGVITSFNPSAEKILGYQASEVINKTTPAIFHDPQEMESRAFALSKFLKKKISPGFEVFTLLADQGVQDTHEWTYIKKDGSRFPVQLSITSVNNSEGENLGYVGIAHDITERKELDRMKNELIGITSYELRSPIASIKGALDLLLLKEFGLPENALKIVNVVQKNCNRLVHLTEDIIDLQKMEAGKMKFNIKKMNVSDFLSHVIELNQSFAQKAQVSLMCQAVPKELSIDADEDRLIQVMNNLLSNAIKYSPEKGQVEISAKIVGNKIHFEVKDQGPGISKEFQSKIFQKFARDTSAANAQKKGMGLGLNIAKSIIERHKGNMSFQSNSQGTIFWFELPLNDLNLTDKK
ncbi:MAG: ATP-binding protein [Parachlamydiaceae bacterium]|nr:ATP-binding protein [Parachlamydiaceae bacterium]